MGRRHARARSRLMPAGGQVRLELPDQIGPLAEDSDLVVSPDDPIPRFGKKDAIAARVARLHLLGGLSVEEPGPSRAVAYRNRKYVRAWLGEALGK
ncbi:MAG: ECF-type sigma factor [Isosphaeraceae bacterium]